MGEHDLEMENIKRLLRCFQLMSGLKINFSKSSLCGVKVQQQDVTALAHVMGCKVDSLPIKYLGLPLGANPRRIKTWEPVIDRTQQKLNVWNGRCMSTGGRLTLLNSNMSPLPVYFMSLFKMPVAVAKTLEKMQRRFFWGDTVEKKKLHLVKWECITKSKTDGGLGVKKLLQQNMALLAKWWWRFSKDKESLWVRVTRGKYNLDQHCWLPYIPSSGSVSNVWRDICSIGDSDSCLGRVVQEGFRVQVNSGNETSFWNHVWLGNKCLKEEYPQLFLASDQQGEMVSSVGEILVNGRWDLKFRRRLFDWENQQKEELELRLQNVNLDPSKPDCLQWNWSTNGCYTVNSAYKRGDILNQLRNSVLGTLWKNLSPPKVEIFTWMVIQERVATRSVLQSRNIISDPQELVCPFCTLHLETPQHLFLHCRFSWAVWSCIVDWWHVKWVCPSSIGALIAWWFGNKFRNLEKEIWESCLYATLWSLWLLRNDYVFNNASMLVWDVADLIKTRVAMWMRTKHNIKLYTVDDFKGYLDGIRSLKL